MTDTNAAVSETNPSENVETVTITFDVKDSNETWAEKAWTILGGQGPYNPTLVQIFAIHEVLLQQKWLKDSMGALPVADPNFVKESD